jgi:hypothetical protein
MANGQDDAKYIDERIDHDAFAETAGIPKPIDIVIPASVWPAGMRPVANKMDGQLPGTKITGPADKADVLMICYTTDETRAMSHVMINSRSFETEWYPYGHNFDALRPIITIGLTVNGKPTLLGSGVLAYLLPVQIGSKTVMLCKPELHPARNGKRLPFIDLIQQLVSEVQPKLVITSGTGGAVGTEVLCGDVVVTDTALFHTENTYPAYPGIVPFKATPGPQPIKNSVVVGTARIDHAINTMCALTVQGLQNDFAKLAASKYKITFVKANQPSKIFVKKVNGAKELNVLTADFFSIDDSHNSEGLEQIGVMDDMDDAFVAFAIDQMKTPPARPKWLSIRNASEPQIPFLGKMSDMKDQASQVYMTCGYHTSLNGAFACWAVVAGMS